MSEVKRKIKARRKTRNGGDGKESSESSERENPLRVVQCAKAKWLPVDLLSEYCIRKGGESCPIARTLCAQYWATKDFSFLPRSKVLRPGSLC